MKNLIFLALIAAALWYGSRSFSGPAILTPQQPVAPNARLADGGAAQDWEQAPKAVMDMQDAMGSGHARSAHAAREAVQRQLR
jgi:hypothetical protein